MEAGTLAAIVGAVSGSQVLTTLIQKYFDQQKATAEATKIDADANKTEVDAASTLVNNMLSWGNSLTNRIAALELQLRLKDKIIADHQAKLVELEKEIIRLKQPPCHSSSDTGNN